MFKKSPLKSSRLVKRKRQIRALKIALTLIIVAGCIFLIVKLAHLYRFQIHSVAVVGNTAVDTGSITALVNNDMAGSYDWVIPKTNIFFYPKVLIKNDLLSSFLRLNSVAISESHGVLTVSVTERVPAYTWCGEMPASIISPAQSNGCYFMDASGYIFGEAPIFSGTAFFPLYGALDTTDIGTTSQSTSTVSVSDLSASTTSPIGQQFLNTADLQKFQSLISFLQSHTLNPSMLVVGSDDVDTIYLASGTQIIFTDDEDADTLSANLEAIISNTSLFDPHATSTLDYLDLRFGDKVYYRFKP